MTDWRRFIPRRRARTAAAGFTCREMVELVTAYLDDALEPAPRSALERHLADCPHCTEYFAQIRLVRDAAGRVAPQDMAEDLAEQLAPEAKRDLMDLFTRWQADPESSSDSAADEPGPETASGR